VADAHEAGGEHMEQEPAEELVGRERHRPDAVPVGIILPAEAHLGLVPAGESVSGERHAGGVAPEGLPDLGGAGE